MLKVLILSISFVHTIFVHCNQHSEAKISDNFAVCQGQANCNCPCDIISNKCDINCCCDQDCSNKQFSLFTISCERNIVHSRSRGLNENGVQMTKCNNIGKKDIGMIDKPAFSFQRLSDFIEEEFKDLLCVRYDNSAVTGVNYEDSDADSNMMDREIKVKDFNTVMGKNIHRHDNQFGTGYTIGDFVTIIKASESDKSLIHSSESSLTLPGPSDGGFCIPNNALQFGIDIDRSCIVSIEDLERRCTQSFDVKQFITDIYVFKSKTKMIRSSFDSDSEDNFLNVTIGSFDFDDGMGTATDSNDKPFTYWDSKNKICFNALTHLSYKVYYDSSRKITDVVADIVSINVGNKTTTLHQQFEIDYIPHFSEEAEYGLETVANDYQFSSPVLARSREHDDNVQVKSDKLMIMGPGHCLSQRNQMVVGFGEDTSVSCTIPLDRHELEEFCSLTSNGYMVTQKGSSDDFDVPKWLKQNQTLIGRHNNARPTIVDDWLEFVSNFDSPDFIVKERVWNSFKKHCEGMITSARYRFLWTHVGNVVNPQVKIIGVTLEYDESKILIHRLNDDVKQHFQFTTTVSWRYIKPTENVAHLSLPQMIFFLPEDVFYPFKIHKSSGSTLTCHWIKNITLTLFVISYILLVL